MSRRTRYLRVSKRDDHPLFSASWTRGPCSKHDKIGYLLFAKAAVGKQGALELAYYDFQEDLLSDAILNTIEEDVPRVLAVHPGGDEVLCSFDSNCKLYGLERTGNLKIRPSERDLSVVKGLGAQDCLLFSTDGCRLAASGKDGHLRVFEWPRLNIIFDQPVVHRPFKDLDISLDGAFLACIVDDGRCCYIWDVAESKLIATLCHDEDEKFGFSRFSRDGSKPFLFITTTKAGSSSIAVWNMDGWGKLGVKKFLRVPITAIAIGQDGKQLAIASSRGDIHVVDIKKMIIVERVRSAHLSPIISLEFSPNCRALLSMSADSTARVTAVKNEKEWKEWQIYILLALMVLISAILFYLFFEFSDSFWNFPLGRDQPAKPPLEAVYGNAAHPDQ